MNIITQVFNPVDKIWNYIYPSRYSKFNSLNDDFRETRLIIMSVESMIYDELGQLR